MKKLGFQVSLNGTVLGSIELSTRKSLIPWNIFKEIESAIATVCFMREDDLMKTHKFSDFEVKGCTVEV